MDLITVRDLFKNTEKYAGIEVNVGGWVRNRRGSKQFGFIVLNDGTYFTPVQVVYNDTLENFQEISKMFVIGFVEFFATHRNIVGNNLLYFPSAIIEMAGYLILTLAASFLLRWLEKRLDGSDNYELASTDSLAMSAGTYSHPSRKTPFDERSGEFGSGRPKGEY